MDFRAVDVFYIASGASVGLEFWWKPPGDKGAVWAMAHPLPGEPSSYLITERVMKRVGCRDAGVSSEGYVCADPGTAYWRYAADFTNDSVNGCRFQLEGGGF